jgi:anti-anti-sigma regulatory factor
MEIRENDTLCVIAPIQNELSDYKVKRIIDRINRETRKVSIDLSNVDSCSNFFIESLTKLKDKDLSIFNINSDIFVLFNLMNIDKTLKLFVSELDFEEDARRLINRKFSIV